MSADCNILCTICARGGSQGVKNKNVRPLLGKPLIAYTIRQALNWGRAKHVVVSTDSKWIANIAKRYGADIPFMRPKRLATNTAAKLLSIRHAVIESEKFFRERYGIIVDLDPTAPIRNIKDLDSCLRIFRIKKPKTLFSVVKAYKNPYFNMVEKKENGFVRLCKELSREVVRRQDAPEVYNMNASIYFYTREFLLGQKHITPFSNKTAIYIMDQSSRYDIDSEVDFKFIEFLMRERIWRSEV